MTQRTFHQSPFGWKYSTIKGGLENDYSKPERSGSKLVSERQIELIKKLCEALNKPVPDLYFVNRRMAVKLIDDLFIELEKKEKQNGISSKR